MAAGCPPVIHVLKTKPGRPMTFPVFRDGAI
jgi:hypothetical protein